MNDTITTEPITTQQLRALRHADTVVFSARQDGSGEMRASVDADHSSTGFEQSLTIPMPNRSGRMQGRTGFESLHNYHEGWRTFVHHVLRTGDVLVLDFRPDHGTNDYARAAKGDPTLIERDDDIGSLYYTGLHVDEFWLRVERGTKVLEFLMEVRVGPENSARMCSLVR